MARIKAQMGRPRLFVDFAILSRIRDIDNLGWSRMAEAYRKATGKYISRDTIKRRYLEAKTQKAAPHKWSPSAPMKVYLDFSETELMEQAANCQRNRLLIRLLSRLGCRISEALALKVGDIDFEQGTITIIHLKAHLKLSCTKCGQRLGRSHSFCPKCGDRVEMAQRELKERHRQRVLPIDGDTLKSLRDYIQHGGPVIKEGNSLIFGINRHRAWQVVKGCAEKAGLSRLVNPETGKLHNVSPHRLRDAFAVHAVKLDDSGDGLRMLQEHLGHLSFNTTARYRKVAGDEHRQWYQRLWTNQPIRSG